MSRPNREFPRRVPPSVTERYRRFVARPDVADRFTRHHFGDFDVFGSGSRHWGGGSPPPVPPTPKAPTEDDAATKAKTDAAAAAARALALRRGGAAANILAPRAPVGARSLSLVGGGEAR